VRGRRGRERGARETRSDQDASCHHAGCHRSYVYETHENALPVLLVAAVSRLFSVSCRIWRLGGKRPFDAMHPLFDTKPRCSRHPRCYLWASRLVNSNSSRAASETSDHGHVTVSGPCLVPCMVGEFLSAHSRRAEMSRRSHLRWAKWRSADRTSHRSSTHTHLPGQSSAVVHPQLSLIASTSWSPRPPSSSSSALFAVGAAGLSSQTSARM
jgi:hypothetical protein